MGELAELTAELVAFREARDWGRFHALRHLIVSLNLEAGELLELIQWKSDAEVEALAGDGRLHDECADVLLYLLLIAERSGFDLVAAARAKLIKNARKYPVDKARGTCAKYTELG